MTSRSRSLIPRRGGLFMALQSKRRFERSECGMRRSKRFLIADGKSGVGRDAIQIRDRMSET